MNNMIRVSPCGQWLCSLFDAYRFLSHIFIMLYSHISTVATMYLSTHCMHWHTSFLTYLWCASVTPSLYAQLPDCFVNIMTPRRGCPTHPWLPLTACIQLQPIQGRTRPVWQWWAISTLSSHTAGTSTGWSHQNWSATRTQVRHQANVGGGVAFSLVWDRQIIDITKVSFFTVPRPNTECKQQQKQCNKSTSDCR